MACVGLLTVCLLRPPAPQPQPQPQPPRHPQLAPDPGPAGHALFQDVFRRADKNDDGKLSFEEFQNYFADGVLSPGELQELFSGIDGHLTDNLETEKLCDYFAEHLGVYRPVLAALESLNRAVLAAMDATKLEYERASKVDQFVTRFLLRETVSQLQALQSSLEGASDTLEAQARGWRYVRALLTCRASAQAPTVPPFQIPTVLASWSLYFWAGKPRWGEMRLALALGLGVPGGLFPHPGLSRPGVPVLGPVSLTFSRSDAESTEAQSRPCGSRRTGRRALRSVSRSSTWSPGSSDTGRSSEAEMQWQLQVNRLQELIDQLECKAPRLEPLHEEDLAKGPDSHILVAQRQVQVAEEGLQDFHRALRCYVDFTGAQSHCLHLRLSAGTSRRPAARPSSASSSTTCGLRTPSPLCSSQPPGG
ncbi:N-terminal EF-hand calcium-binding protein 3 isoform X2 [Piliocolobus tephrosceles]|uniref:N-terminal EF-hand calcium-binding protein 3 isoform X2 n=1 Tax=Piliocolobus tephrosceles TaxID=591936 RepID=UPI000C2A4CAB|nr:N-terminal EF-hand calcium-binding protein 3 isoform X2 [Piliocolobus tephrosceles]